MSNAYENGANTNELKELLGKGRAKKGMFEGDLENGELEIGQVSALLDTILPAEEIIAEILSEFKEALNEQNTTKFQF